MTGRWSWESHFPRKGPWKGWPVPDCHRCRILSLEIVLSSETLTREAFGLGPHFKISKLPACDVMKRSSLRTTEKSMHQEGNVEMCTCSIRGASLLLFSSFTERRDCKRSPHLHFSVRLLDARKILSSSIYAPHDKPALTRDSEQMLAILVLNVHWKAGFLW